MKILPQRPRFQFVTGVIPVGHSFPARKGDRGVRWLFVARFGQQNCQTGLQILPPSPPFVPVSWP